MQYKYLLIQIREMTLASLKARYRKTWAGFIWVILNPLLMFGVQSLVFKRFLNLQVEEYYLFLLGGLLPWIFFSQTVQMATPIYVTQSQVLKSFKINPMVILSSQVLDGFINFIATFVLILLPVFFATNRDIAVLFLIPLSLIPLLLGTLSLSVVLSTWNVFFRDTNFITGFVFSLLFFLTPIFYPKEFVPAEWQWIVHINPVMYFVDPFRSAIYSPSQFWYLLLKSMGVALFFTGYAIFIWRKNRNEFYRRL